MNRSILISLVILGFYVSTAAQAARVPPPPEPNAQPVYRSVEPMENIANDVARMARSVEQLNKNWTTFIGAFTTNQGLQLDDRQRKLILALEVLNRLEASLANMQKLRLDLIERQSRFRINLATVTDDLQPQSVDRYVALRGTTDAEGLRDIRRAALEKERRELSQVLSEIGRELYATEADLRRTEQQVRTLRAQVFGEAERQLAGL
jgi:hypothetical protein